MIIIMMIIIMTMITITKMTMIMLICVVSICVIVGNGMGSTDIDNIININNTTITKSTHSITYSTIK